jgi:uncharacterized protein
MNYSTGDSSVHDVSKTKTTESNTYNLNTISTDGHSFYGSLSDFTDHFMPVMQSHAQTFIDDYIKYIHTSAIEPFRSKNEYLLEFLIAGILWNEYTHHARQSSRFVIRSSSLLYSLRSVNSLFKIASDYLRGFLMNMLLHSPPSTSLEPSGKNFFRLMQWLEATGEFTEEIKRLAHLNNFISTFDSEKQNRLLADCSTLACKFKSAAPAFLGKYTGKIASFIEQVSETNRNKENRIFCGRSEVEYHMNMFAAEVMNRQFKEEFISRKNKVVLLPTCMRQQNQNECTAYKDGETLLCAHCTSSCTINILSKKLANHGVQCSLVPHSSDFSRYLKRWQNSTDTALVGVACVLNLLRGGFEMRGLSIASQCVFLDYSGCKKHWHSTGIATSLNLMQLYTILGIDETE